MIFSVAESVKYHAVSAFIDELAPLFSVNFFHLSIHVKMAGRKERSMNPSSQRPIKIFLTLFFFLTIFNLSSPRTEASNGTGFLLNEISPWPSDGRIWVELINISNSSLRLDGWEISFLSGFTHTFQSNSALIRPGEVHLLRLASDSVNHSGDRCMLIGPDGPADAITWGVLSGEYAKGKHTPEMPSGTPLMPPWGVIGDSLYQPDDVLIRIPGSWDEKPVGSINWRYRSGDEASPGRPNPYPGPTNFSPSDGTRIASAVHLAVQGIDFNEGIRFQVATDSGFTNIVYDETVIESSVKIDNLPKGDYFWRVRMSGWDSGEWSGYRSFHIMGIDIDLLISKQKGMPSGIGRDSLLAQSKGGESGPTDLPLFGAEEIIAWHVIGVEHQLQRKDTHLLCLDGCTMEGPNTWEDPHPVTRDHGENYCTRACISMIANSAGGRLSQDRITYFIFQESAEHTRDGREVGHHDDPFMDLGHQMGTYTHTAQYALEWVYDQPHGTGQIIFHGMSVWHDADVSNINTVREFLDDGRPLIRQLPLHSTVIDGYAIVRDEATGEQTIVVHVLDPASPDNVSWIEYDSGEVWSYVAPPPTGIPMRCDEAEISMDSDLDGIMDFDEVNRFNTDPNDPDTDGDGLNDMIDMLGYLFNSDGTYNLRTRDYDEDGLPKELDPDNDHAENNGVNDGCEDINLDGFYNDDGTETDNFMMADDFEIISPYCYQGYLKIEASVNLSAFENSVFESVETIAIENGHPLSSHEYIHQHTYTLRGRFSMDTPMGSINSYVEEYDSTRARILLNVQPNGRYRLVTDTQPQVVQYAISTSGLGMSRMSFEDFHIYFADHHFGYVSPESPSEVFEMLRTVGPPNVFEGEITRDPDGGVRIAGFDTFELSDWFEEIDGNAMRTWEIWIERP